MDRQQILTELLLDDSFREWALSGREQEGGSWEGEETNDPHYAEVVEEAREILRAWQQDRVQLSSDRKEALRSRIASIARTDRATLPRQESPPKEATGSQPNRADSRSKQLWLRVAAGVAGLLIGSGLFWQWNTSHRTEIYYATTYGEIRKVTLPDHSQVTLNGNSAIRYHNAEEQLGEPREVWLEGEAFFEVSQQAVPTSQGNSPGVKFIVHTENLSVQVLGTRFNVRHRRDQTQVVLEEGRVELQLEEQNRSLQMSPDEMVEVHRGDKRVNHQAVKANNYSAWKEGVLYFEGSSFAEISRILEDNYDLTLHFENKKQAEVINLKGAFPANNIDILLEAVANITHTTFRKKGRRIIYR